jgi:hypothetical protein
MATGRMITTKTTSGICPFSYGVVIVWMVRRCNGKCGSSLDGTHRDNDSCGAPESPILGGS